jgi:uncharacterized membrane protein
MATQLGRDSTVVVCQRGIASLDIDLLEPASTKQYRQASNPPVRLTGRCPTLTFKETIETVGKAVDGAGVAAIVIGVVAAAITSLRRWPFRSDDYRLFRQRLGRAILLGLELLVAADIIRTVAVTPTFTSAGVLALIVVIRTFLSFSLEVELEGHWPWTNKRPSTDTPSSEMNPAEPTGRSAG